MNFQTNKTGTAQVDILLKEQKSGFLVKVSSVPKCGKVEEIALEKNPKVNTSHTIHNFEFSHKSPNFNLSWTVLDIKDLLHLCTYKSTLSHESRFYDFSSQSISACI